ncbi:hypothetical protein H1R20_g2232, partial [Candolleomyces eurysporus]
MTTTSKGLNVSLEPHLVEALKQVQNALPEELKAKLSEYVAQSAKPIIPYELLQEVSQWSRTPAGKDKLGSTSMNPQDYSMVSLLAGTTTSPEKSFGDYTPPASPEKQAADRARERKAITALVNSIFSIFGAGFAAWWASDRTGWRDEYKVLFGLAVGIIVAISEGILFLIWTSRRTSAGSRKRDNGRHKKDDADTEVETKQDEPTQIIKASTQQDEGSTLRQRH